MSSLINKVKEAVSSHSSENKSTTTGATTEPTTTHHHTTTGVATHPTTGAATHPTTGAATHSTQGGAFTEGGNYALGDEVNRGASGPASKTDGPHKSNLLNKADPRVDSDADHSKNMGANPGRDATTSRNAENTGSQMHSGTLPSGAVHERAGATTGTAHTRTTGENIPEGTFGHHNSRTANAADPRIDSDLDSRRTHHTEGMVGTTGTHRTTGENFGAVGSGNNIPEGTFGHHNSRAANAADPRINSDLDSRRTHHTEGLAGTTGTHRATGENFGAVGSGNNIPEGTFGHHNSRAANAADPRIDSDLDSRRTHQAGGLGAENTAAYGRTGENLHSTTHGHSTGGVAGENLHSSTSGPGPAPKTAGPHKSDMLNKADPRVDSNLDGSKTYGGNKTYEQGSSTTGRKDPRDATQVPPSVMQKVIGKPTVEHDDAGHDRDRRHSVHKTEKHTGL